MHAPWWSIFRMGEVVPIYYSIIAFFCTVGAIALAIFHIYRHLLNYTEPTYQRYIVRIIFMVPVSFPSLHFIHNSEQILFVFCLVVVSFGSFLVDIFMLEDSVSPIYASLHLFLTYVSSLNFLISRQFTYVCVHLLFVFLFVTFCAFSIYIYINLYILFSEKEVPVVGKSQESNFWP